MENKASWYRFPLLALAILTFLVGLWVGLVRLGWPWPVIQPGLVMEHGPLMVSGFLGGLIILERAVALRHRWMYIGTILCGLGVIAAIFNLPGIVALLLFNLGSLMLIALFVIILRTHLTLYTMVMASGAVAWFIGNLFLLFGWPIFRVVLWWEAFLILTILGERLELGRLLQLSKTAQRAVIVSIGLLVIGLFISIGSYDWGMRLFGLGMLTIALWLLRYDLARHTVRKTGLPRFAALALLCGYFWLAVGGIIAMIFGGIPAGPIYDAFIHAIFIGFVFSMIFAHAPIIFPSILGLVIRYHPVLYVPLITLQLSLILRTVGDLAVIQPARLWGGLLNGLSILLYLGLTLVIMIRSSRDTSTK